MRTNGTNQSGWQRVLSLAATVAASAVMAFALTACGGDDETAAPPATVAAPGAPTALTATGGENVVTLQWSPPAASASVGLPDSYEIYRSTTATTNPATIVAPANFVTSIPVVAGMLTSYTNTGLPGQNTTYYFVVTAKNTGGETPSSVASAAVTGPPNPATYGNNFSAALIFADDIGITNLPITGSWTPPPALIPPAVIDYNTGLRPLATETIATLPSLTLPSHLDPAYYEQKSINTWQGEWAKANGADQFVNAKWGDNLTSARLSASAKIRIEMVLTTTVPTPMTTYTMRLLSGSGTNELQGTNGVVILSTTAFVFATNAHLTIQKLDAAGVPTGALIVNQALFDPAFPDGLNKLAGEINVAGNFTYGFIWDPSTSGSTAGRYRVTFNLDPISQFGAGTPANNTFMTTATNGVLDSPVAAHIDIVVQ